MGGCPSVFLGDSVATRQPPCRLQERPHEEWTRVHTVVFSQGQATLQAVLGGEAVVAVVTGPGGGIWPGCCSTPYSARDCSTTESAQPRGEGGRPGVEGDLHPREFNLIHFCSIPAGSELSHTF